MKRILVDARMVKAEGHGIGNYVLQLATGLATRQLPYEMMYLVDPALPKGHPLRALPHRDCAIPFLHPLEPFTLAKEIARYKPGLYHSPSFASLWRYPCPHVQTVHDLNHLHFGSLAHRLYYSWILLPSTRSARALITVSESSRREIGAWLNSQGAGREILLAENAILAAPAAASAAPLAHWQLQAGKYFLAVSNNRPFKNLAMLKEAYLAAGEGLPPLVISTPGESGKGIVHIGAVADAELQSLYAHARAIFFPSLYEGFGRPPLEGAVAGAVPVVSDIPPHREVLAGVREAVFLPAEQTEAWTKAFQHPPPAGLSATSREWILKRYSVENLVTQMEAIYGAAIG